LKDLSTRNFANANEIRSLGLELVQYVPMALDRISSLDMETVWVRVRLKLKIIRVTN
jgi:hypothetical protein